MLRGVGKQKGGLYYLVNSHLSQLDVSILHKPLYVKGDSCVATSLVDQLSRNKLLMNKCITDNGECVVNRTDYGI